MSQDKKMNSSFECSSKQLENIEEECPASWEQIGGAPPETPTESMEFLSRSWSLSAMELSKALSHTHVIHNNLDKPPSYPVCAEAHAVSSPTVSTESLYRGIMKGKKMGKWLKDQKERKKQEIRANNAQLHAAVSVAGVAAAVAALTTTNVTSPETSITRQKEASRTSAAAIASAAALVASHCIDIAEDMGADHNHLVTVVNSAINARTNGDIMTLTAGAATALRGAAILSTRLQKGHECTTFILADERLEEGKEIYRTTASEYVSTGGELLKRTRKGALHWKEVSFNINSDFQVVAKMKSRHMKGTFTKKKKCIILGVYNDIPAWPGREREEHVEPRAYFGIKTVERTIEFECRNKGNKQMWIDGVQHMLHICDNIS